MYYKHIHCICAFKFFPTNWQMPSHITYNIIYFIVGPYLYAYDIDCIQEKRARMARLFSWGRHLRRGRLHRSWWQWKYQNISRHRDSRLYEDCCEVVGMQEIFSSNTCSRSYSRGRNELYTRICLRAKKINTWFNYHSNKARVRSSAYFSDCAYRPYFW